MEKYFILRLPDQLKGIDFTESKLIKISNKEVKFIFNNVTYNGVIAKLPTIIEAQKTIDDKLYKVSDISTLIVIYSNMEINVDEEISKLEKSGLTPPMNKITDIWKSNLPLDNTEQQVADLLAEDAKAVKVEIIENEENTADIDEFAAELENVIPNSLVENVESIITKKLEINEENKTKEEMILNKTITKIEDNLEKDDDNTELLEIQTRIKEKKKLLENALNPILKKRFLQAIEDLEKEYENKKKFK